MPVTLLHPFTKKIRSVAISAGYIFTPVGGKSERIFWCNEWSNSSSLNRLCNRFTESNVKRSHSPCRASKLPWQYLLALWYLKGCLARQLTVFIRSHILPLLCQFVHISADRLVKVLSQRVFRSVFHAWQLEEPCCSCSPPKRELLCGESLEWF